MGAKQELVKELEKKEVMDKSDKDDYGDGDGVVNCPSRQSLKLFVGPLIVCTQITRKYSTELVQAMMMVNKIQIMDKLDKDGDDDVNIDDFLSCISVWKLTQHWLDGDDGNN